MDKVNRFFYIYCKDCKNDIVEYPNLYGLCSECKIKYFIKENERKKRNQKIVEAFYKNVDEEQKNKFLLTIFLEHNICHIDLKDKLEL